MAGLTQVNGTAFARDVLYSTGQLKAFKITPTTALTAGLAGTIRSTVDEIGSHSMMFQSASDGSSLIAIGDGHAVNATVIDARLTAVLGEAVTVAEITDLYGIA